MTISKMITIAKCTSFAAVLLNATSALAFSGGYSTSVIAPQINTTVYQYTSANWAILQGWPTVKTPKITVISWFIGYTNTVQGTKQVQVCNYARCTPWGNLTVTSSAFFLGDDVKKPFYFRARVIEPTGTIFDLRPPVYPNGNSNISVNWEY